MTSVGAPHTCKLSTSYNTTPAQFNEMENMVASRFTALEEQMQRRIDELASKLEGVKSNLEEVKRSMSPNVTSTVQNRRVSRIKGNADALSAPIQRIRLAETQLDAIAQAFNQSSRKDSEHRGERLNV